MDCGRGKGGKNAPSTEEARGEWRTKGRKADGEEGRKETARKEENVGGMAESRREKKSVSLRRGKGKEEYGKGGFGGKTGERASDRASERARSARRCTVKGVS